MILSLLGQKEGEAMLNNKFAERANACAGDLKFRCWFRAVGRSCHVSLPTMCYACPRRFASFSV